MRQVCLVVLAAASLLSAATVRADWAQPAPQQDLINAVDAYRAAIVAGQRGALSDLPRYRVVGSSGVVSGVLRWRMTYRGRESSIERRTTMTWVRDGKVRRLLGQHVSRPTLMPRV